MCIGRSRRVSPTLLNTGLANAAGTPGMPSRPAIELGVSPIRSERLECRPATRDGCAGTPILLTPTDDAHQPFQGACVSAHVHRPLPSSESHAPEYRVRQCAGTPSSIIGFGPGRNLPEHESRIVFHAGFLEQRHELR